MPYKSMPMLARSLQKKNTMSSLSSRLIDNSGGMVIPVAAGLLVALVSYQLVWPAKKTVFDTIPKAPFNVARSFDLLTAIRPDPFTGVF